MKEHRLIGRRIVNAEIDGYGISLKLDDGTVFEYYASDGGFSSWDISKNGESLDEEKENEKTVKEKEL